MFEGGDEIVLVGMYGVVSICMYRCGFGRDGVGVDLGEFLGVKLRVWEVIRGLGITKKRAGILLKKKQTEFFFFYKTALPLRRGCPGHGPGAPLARVRCAWRGCAEVAV